MDDLSRNCDNTGPGEPLTTGPQQYINEVAPLIKEWAVTASEGLVVLTDPNGSSWFLSPERAWDLGDDLLIASGRVWQDESGKPYNPDWAEGLTDQEYLDERATGILFTEEAMADLRVLATERGKSLPQLIREEMMATLGFYRWADSLSDEQMLDLQVGQDPEGEDGDGHAVPSVDEPVAVAEPVAQAEQGGEDVQQESKHGS